MNAHHAMIRAVAGLTLYLAFRIATVLAILGLVAIVTLVCGDLAVTR